MPKPVFHKDVNYEVLSLTEKKIKASRELFTIFYLYGKDGLTDLEIFNKTQELKMTGYAGLTEDCIVRSSVYRWNDIAISSITGGKICENSGCKKICSWGYEKNNPSHCARHKLDEMVRVVEERLIRMPKELGQTHRKFYLDPQFAAKVFPQSTPLESEFSESSIDNLKIDSQVIFTEHNYLKEFTDMNMMLSSDVLEMANTDFLDDSIDFSPLNYMKNYVSQNSNHDNNTFQDDYEFERFQKMNGDELMNFDLDSWLLCAV